MWFWRDKSASDAAVEDDDVARLERAMRKVPKLDREIFMAHRLDDMTYAEIAGISGRSVARVEKAISRTLIILDRELSRRS